MALFCQLLQAAHLAVCALAAVQGASSAQQCHQRHSSSPPTPASRRQQLAPPPCAPTETVPLALGIPRQKLWVRLPPKSLVPGVTSPLDNIILLPFGATDLRVAGLPTTRSADGVAPLLKTDDPSSGWSYGSGNFGNWSADEFGLPRYTVTGRAAAEEISKANGGFLHQFGNDRMILVAMTDGSVAMRQDEGGAKILNHRDKTNRQHGGAVGFLSEGSQVLLHTYNNGTGDIEMQLGSGYFRKRVRSDAARLSIEHSVVAPHGDHSFAVIVVNITNESPRARLLKYTETWSRLMRELHTPGRWKQIVKEKSVSASDFALQVTHRVQELTGDAPGLLDTVLPPRGGPAEPPRGSLFPAASQHDYSPRPAFLRVIDGGTAPTRAACNGTALFPHDSSLLPDLTHGFSCRPDEAYGPETILALDLDVQVPAASSTVRYMAFGYIAPRSAPSTALPKKFVGQEVVKDIWKTSSEAWRTSSITFAAPDVGDWLERETLWHSHMLRAALTYDSYWDGYVLDQNGGYMYASGDNDAMARDPLNHALPLLFYAPHATRGGIRLAVSSTHNVVFTGGRIPKATFGFGLGYEAGSDKATASDRAGWCCYPSDLELWILNAAMRYIVVTRDFNFLIEPVKSAWGEITMADALWKITHHLLEVESVDGGVGLGPHGLLRMLTMDYNDGILLAPGNDMNVSLNNHSAESVLNSAQVVGILESYSAILAAVPPAVARTLGNLSTNVSHLRALETQQRQSVQATWGGSWFARMWAPDSGWFGTEHNSSIWWSNAFPLLNKISPTDRPANRERLVNAIDAGLLSKNPTGVPFSNRSSHADYQDSWFAGSMYLIEALGQRGYQHLAYKAWKKGLLATHATYFPSQFAGIYSASDHYADGTDATVYDTNQIKVGSDSNGVAIFNSWAHTTPLFGVLAMIGAEFDVRGVTLRPSGLRPNVSGTFESYNVSTPILGLAKMTNPLVYSGWYIPLVQDNSCAVRIELSVMDAAGLKTLKANGHQQPLSVQGGVVTIRAAVCDIRWELRSE